MLKRSMSWLTLAVLFAVPMLVAVRLWAEPLPATTAVAAFTSAQGYFRVTYTSEPIVINRMHSWQLQLEDAEGRPVTGAVIAVDGGMPAHNHGLPTRPQVIEAAGAGDYRIDGLRFHMPGNWEVRLQITAGALSDEVVITLSL
ncbi:FixH family protein [Parahaliea maris]|uniref:FixH family protein n=1 Tax=Parahaliea maris TaxID=2716870 RepID=A0A5C8ZWW6_9GAMM|nr:FixH family protein [Parahaliea maris]TXS92060.1 FixH family protein [Parahaliea maris]